MTYRRQDPIDLEAIEWAGEACFRVLDTYLTVRHDDAEIGRYVGFVLGGFEVDPDPHEFRNPPTPNVPPRYSLCMDARKPDDIRWCLFYGDTLMISTPTPGATLTHLFWNINAEAIRQTGSYLLIHAGSVVSPTGQCVLLPAESGSGKTTLVAALLRDGFSYLSDEAAVIDPVLRQVHPFPKALTLKSGSFSLFPELRESQLSGPVPDTWHVRPDQLRAGSAVTGPAEVRFVVAPRYDSAVAGVELTALSPGETALVLASSSLNLRRYGSRALPVVADLARGARGYRMRFNDLAAASATVHKLTSCLSKAVAPEETS